jgi:hypothetical protein
VYYYKCSFITLQNYSNTQIKGWFLCSFHCPFPCSPSFWAITAAPVVQSAVSKGPHHAMKAVSCPQILGLVLATETFCSPPTIELEFVCRMKKKPTEISFKLTFKFNPLNPSQFFLKVPILRTETERSKISWVYWL